MSDQVQTHHIKGYVDGINHLAQQKMSRLRRGVRVETGLRGEKTSFDYLGVVTATQLTSRHADTPLTDTPHSRRWVTPLPFAHADLVARQDLVRILNDPTSQYSVVFARAFARAIDDQIIAAYFATAETGQDGSGSAAFDSTNYQIAAGGDGLTLTKIISANKLLRAAENDPEDGFFFAVSQEQFEDLLGDSTITSADYNSVRALMAGTITSFMGFEWLPSERLDVDGSSARRCPAWARMTMLLGTADEPRGRVSERADKNYEMQVWYYMDIGATRTEETGVVECLCVE